MQRHGVTKGMTHGWRMVASSGEATLGWDDVLGKQLGALEKLAEFWKCGAFEWLLSAAGIVRFPQDSHTGNKFYRVPRLDSRGQGYFSLV